MIVKGENKMTHGLTKNSSPDELLRLKKTVRSIGDLLRALSHTSYDHLGFSYALAVAKAEELKDQVSPFCPAQTAIQDLIQALKMFSSHPTTAREMAERSLESIDRYFDLGRYLLLKR